MSDWRTRSSAGDREWAAEMGDIARWMYPFGLSFPCLLLRQKGVFGEGRRGKEFNEKDSEKEERERYRESVTSKVYSEKRSVYKKRIVASPPQRV